MASTNGTDIAGQSNEAAGISDDRSSSDGRFASMKQLGRGCEPDVRRCNGERKDSCGGIGV